MKSYEKVKAELLNLGDEDIITTSYPLGDEGTETPILPQGAAGAEVGDISGVASNY